MILQRIDTLCPVFDAKSDFGLTFHSLFTQKSTAKLPRCRVYARTWHDFGRTIHRQTILKKTAISGVMIVQVILMS
jgi:hypothetical protein